MESLEELVALCRQYAGEQIVMLENGVPASSPIFQSLGKKFNALIEEYNRLDAQARDIIRRYQL